MKCQEFDSFHISHAGMWLISCRKLHILSSGVNFNASYNGMPVYTLQMQYQCLPNKTWLYSNSPLLVTVWKWILKCNTIYSDIWYSSSSDWHNFRYSSWWWSRSKKVILIVNFWNRHWVPTGGAIGDCINDQFILSSSGNQASPIICGFNTGQHSNSNWLRKKFCFQWNNLNFIDSDNWCI